MAAHLLGVVAIYGIALVIGGGWGAGVFPLPTAAPRSAEAAPPVARHLASAAKPAAPATSPTLPAWTQRVEVAAPWEGR